MKRKTIIILVVCYLVLLFAGVNVFLDFRVAPTPDPRITMEPVRTDFLYGHLTEEEKTLYAAMTQELLRFEPRLIRLDTPMTLDSLWRVNHAIDMNDERFFYYGMFLPLDEQETPIDLSRQDVPVHYVAPLLISMLFADVPETQDLSYYILYPFAGELPEIQGEAEINALLAESVDDEDIEQYRTMDAQMQSMLDEAVSGLPQDCTAQQAVQHFAKYLRRFPFYTFPQKPLEEIAKEDWEQLILAKRLSVLITGRGDFAGYAQIMNTLLNRVGIPGYIVWSTDGYVWNEIKMGDRWRNIISAYLAVGYPVEYNTDRRMRAVYHMEKKTDFPYDKAY